MTEVIPMDDMLEMHPDDVIYCADCDVNSKVWAWIRCNGRCPFCGVTFLRNY